MVQVDRELNDNVIRNMLSTVTVEPGSHEVTLTEADYQKIFSVQGLRNAERLISAVSSSPWTVAPEQACVISIGGADGAELEHVVRSGIARHGVLVELSELGCAAARRRFAALSESVDGVRVEVFQGDVSTLVNTVERCLGSLRDEGITGVILSFQAVLHELPRRSSNFDPQLIFEKLLHLFESKFVYCNEPSTVENWPAVVEVKLPGVSAEQLAKMAEFLRDRLRFPASAVIPVGRYVRMDSNLALEVLHKVLRSINTEEFAYECDEQLTSFDAEGYGLLLQMMFGLFVVVERRSSPSFSAVYRRHMVHTRSLAGATLNVPNSHVEIVAFSGPAD